MAGRDAPWHDLALTPTTDGTTIPVRAAPRAAKNGIDGVREGALRVRLAAPPVEGVANRALIAYLAGVLGAPKRDLALAGGERGRNKLVHVRGLSPAEVRRRLAESAGGG